MKLIDLFEGLTSVVYHTTSPRNAQRILKDNKFTLSSSSGGREGSFSNGKMYWLSTARSIHNAFAQGINTHITFVMDGRKLANTYSAKPINYFAKTKSLSGPEYDEMEDRLFSKSRFIENASKYITKIIISSFDGTITSNESIKIKEVVELSETLNIPIQFSINGKPVSYEQFTSLDIQHDDVPDPVHDDSKEIVNTIFKVINNEYSSFSEIKKDSKKALPYVTGNTPYEISNQVKQLTSAHSHNTNIDPLIQLIQKKFKGNIDNFAKALFDITVRLP